VGPSRNLDTAMVGTRRFVLPEPEIGAGTLGLIRRNWLDSKQYASTQALDVQLARLLPFTAVRAIRIIEQLEAQTCVWRVEVKNVFVRFVREDAGQDLIEYSLLAAIIAVGSIVVMGNVKDAINAVFAKVVTALNTA